MTPPEPAHISEAEKLDKLKKALAENHRLAVRRRQAAVRRAYLLPRYDLLAVTAVLTARENPAGGKAMGRVDSSGKVVPVDPYLIDTASHPP